MTTPYHAKYFAHELTRRCPSDSVERPAGALVDVQVDRQGSGDVWHSAGVMGGAVPEAILVDLIGSIHVRDPAQPFCQAIVPVTRTVSCQQADAFVEASVSDQAGLVGEFEGRQGCVPGRG